MRRDFWRLRRGGGGFALTFQGQYGILSTVKNPPVRRSLKTQDGRITMERIKTLETRSLCESAKKGGCGECQTSCQSACKTSCGVANQKCENK